jgi:hypothetical protein
MLPGSQNRKWNKIANEKKNASFARVSRPRADHRERKVSILKATKGQINSFFRDNVSTSQYERICGGGPRFVSILRRKAHHHAPYLVFFSLRERQNAVLWTQEESKARTAAPHTFILTVRGVCAKKREHLAASRFQMLIFELHSASAGSFTRAKCGEVRKIANAIYARW